MLSGTNDIHQDKSALTMHAPTLAPNNVGYYCVTKSVKGTCNVCECSYLGMKLVGTLVTLCAYIVF